MPVHEVAERGFGRAAGEYERGRPGYPPEAVEFLVRELALAPGRTVLDVGAGTGKLTRLLQPSGARVLALEPVAGMREQLLAAVPGVELVGGTAEAIELPDEAVQAVTSATAFHWFDTEPALREFHRVLVPGGRLALLWNARDESVDWVADIAALVSDAVTAASDDATIQQARSWSASTGAPRSTRAGSSSRSRTGRLRTCRRPTSRRRWRGSARSASCRRCPTTRAPNSPNDCAGCCTRIPRRAAATSSASRTCASSTASARADSAEQVAVGRHDEVARRALARDLEPTDDGRGDAGDLAHDQLGSAGDLVGDCDRRRAQLVAGRVARATEIEQRR